MIKNLIKTKIAIVGAGPVGLAAANFCEKFKIDYQLIDRNTKIIKHPAAHVLHIPVIIYNFYCLNTLC